MKEGGERKKQGEGEGKERREDRGEGKKEGAGGGRGGDQWEKGRRGRDERGGTCMVIVVASWRNVTGACRRGSRNMKECKFWNVTLRMLPLHFISTCTPITQKNPHP